jgi:hypothetical protein
MRYLIDLGGMTMKLLGLLVLLYSTTLASDARSDAWQTRAESSEFRATSSYEETLSFLARLAARQPAFLLTDFGRSAEGRPLPLLIVSRERAFSPEAAWELARAQGKPIVLIQSAIHAGEVDGKDASLRLLRELAFGRADRLLDAATMLFVPIYNVDGHERVSPFHRPNQDGPELGMGFRTTTAGYDLNRDHLKLETVEARALIALFNRWRPHLHLDNHVTNGTDVAWDLMFAWAEAPQLAAPLDRWRSEHLPAVFARLAARGHSSGPYISLHDDLDPTRGFDTSSGSPRFSTGYYPLRQRLSILVETHSHKPFRTRVEANQVFLEELLRELGSHGRALVAATLEAESHEVALGRADAPASELALTYRAPAARQRCLIPFRDWAIESSVVTGERVLLYREGSRRDVEVPCTTAVEVDRRVTRPRGYLIQAGWPQIVELLDAHALRYERLVAAREVEVEVLVIAPDTRFATEPYQGRHSVQTNVTRVRERRSFPIGTLFVPADQIDFEVAAQLFEPEAPDSLISWGMLSTLFESKEWIDSGVLERWARQQLKQPEVTRAWEQALTDETLMRDPQRRRAWWWSRHPSFDRERYRLPIYRVVGDVAPFTTAGDPASH